MQWNLVSDTAYLVDQFILSNTSTCHDHWAIVFLAYAFFCMVNLNWIESDLIHRNHVPTADVTDGHGIKKYKIKQFLNT